MNINGMLNIDSLCVIHKASSWFIRKSIPTDTFDHFVARVNLENLKNQGPRLSTLKHKKRKNVSYNKLPCLHNLSSTFTPCFRLLPLKSLFVGVERPGGMAFLISSSEYLHGHHDSIAGCLFTC